MRIRKPVPRLAIFKLASCDGCQLTLLDAEDHLLDVAGAVDIAWFPEASSRLLDGPYDVGLVEGSVTTHHDAARIQEIRRACKVLVAIGACATSGGIQALRNFRDRDELVRYVYPRPELVDTLQTSTPISEHVKVDLEMKGCPISKAQLLDVLTVLLQGRTPKLPAYSVCMECKRKGQVCLMISQGLACLGPVTSAGCGALCPGTGRGCFGCFGPMETPNTASLAARLSALGLSDDDVARAFHGFTAWAGPFRHAPDALRAHPAGARP